MSATDGAGCSWSSTCPSATTAQRAAVLRLNRPDKLNPIDWDMVRALDAALDAVEADPDVRCVLVTGDGPCVQRRRRPQELHHAAARPGRVPALRRGPARARSGGCVGCACPSIALVNGVTAAGGLELLLNCDFTLVAALGPHRRRPPQLRPDGRRWRAHAAAACDRPRACRRADLLRAVPRRRRGRRVGHRRTGSSTTATCSRPASTSPVGSPPRARSPSRTPRPCSTSVWADNGPEADGLRFELERNAEYCLTSRTRRKGCRRSGRSGHPGSGAGDVTGAVADADSTPYLEGLAEGVLRLQRCKACGRHRFPPMPSCPWCGATATEVVTATGTGRVYSWITVHRAFDERWAADVPYTLAAVELDEGCRVFARVDAAPGEVGRRPRGDGTVRSRRGRRRAPLRAGRGGGVRAAVAGVGYTGMSAASGRSVLALAARGVRQRPRRRRARADRRRRHRSASASCTTRSRARRWRRRSRCRSCGSRSTPTSGGRRRATSSASRRWRSRPVGPRPCSSSGR